MGSPDYAANQQKSSLGLLVIATSDITEQVDTPGQVGLPLRFFFSDDTRGLAGCFVFPGLTFRGAGLWPRDLLTYTRGQTPPQYAYMTL